MENILLPTDFSENSRQAIIYAMQFLSGKTCNFYLLNVQKSSGYLTADILYGSPTSSIYEGILSENRKELEEMKEFCKAHSKTQAFTFFTQVDFNDIVNAVNQSITANKIDLVIMGSTGATGAAGVLFGSNTLKLIRNAACPVLAVPKDYSFQKIESVLLSFNYEFDVPKKSLDMISEIVMTHKASLKILEILEEGVEMTPENKFDKKGFEEMSFEYFSIKNIPPPMAISAFQQLLPVELHALIVPRESFLGRFIFGSDTSRISYSSPVPLLALHG